MPYTITPAENAKYVVVKVIGDQTRELANQQMVDANAVAAPLGIRCYLMDMTESRNVEKVLDNYKFAHSDVRNSPDTDRRACVALLAAPDDHSHDFYATLAASAGLNVTLFRDRAEAIAHLEDSADRRPPPAQDEI